ncbi:MAG: tyrosine-type recombinase/integrase [Parvularculaceae bacterium]
MRGKKIALKGLHVVAGGRYVYAWRGGPRLHSPIGSVEFFAEFQRAIESRKALPAGDTIKGLILEFRASLDFRKLAPATRADHERAFEAIISEFGRAPIAAFADARIRRDIRRWHDNFPHDRQADKMLASLSRLLSFAVADGHLLTNPALDVENRYTREADPTPVSEADLAHVLSSPETDEQTALAIRVMARSGLARADAASLTWAHVRSDRIDKRRVKSKQRAQPPMTDELRAALNACPRVDNVMTVLTVKGRPWRADSLGKSIAKAFRSAGLKHSSHDLRATYACYLFRRGASDQEAAEMLGWSEETVRQIRRHYIDDDAIFEGRIAKFSAQIENTDCKNAVKTQPNKKGSGA